MLFQTKRLNVRNAELADIGRILYLERHPDNRDYIWTGTEAEHQMEIRDPEHILCMFDARGTDQNVGYALIRLNPKSHVFELRRLAIDQKGRGYGREVLRGLFDYAFCTLGVNRFWLDVFPDNAVGIRLYESLGMHRDGVLRQNYLSERGYLDQIVYSLLKSEYEAMQ